MRVTIETVDNGYIIKGHPVHKTDPGTRVVVGISEFTPNSEQVAARRMLFEVMEALSLRFSKHGVRIRLQLIDTNGVALCDDGTPDPYENNLPGDASE